MSDKENKILETFERIVPDLTEDEKERLLSYGEGYADGIRAGRKKSLDLKRKQNALA